MRPYALGLAAVVAGCAALDGLAGGEDDPGASPGKIDGPACTAPGAPRCEHGSCIDERGDARCSCDAGWTGPTCGECAVGSACSGASCAETKCAAHASCDDSAGSPSCKCVAGYTQAGADCAFTGVVRDPTFENKPAGAWSLSGGVTIDPTAEGAKNLGLAELRTATCDAAGVKQAFEMPAIADAEPLAMEVFARGTCQITFIGVIPLPCFRPISLSIAGRGVEPMPMLLGNGSAKVCLGERAFGATVPLELFPSACGSTVKSLALDHVDVVPAPECPSPGVVVNGDFEGAGGWTVGGTGAEVAAGVGNQGSRGGRLRSAKRCDNPKLTSALSVRVADPAKPALAFTVKGTLNRRMRVYANGYPIGVVSGTAVYEKVSLCVPEYLRGMSASLLFSLEDDRPDGACGDPDDYEFVIDDLSLGQEAACNDPLLVEGGFERADAARYWVASESGGSVSFVRNAPAGANGGSGYATVRQTECAKSSNVRTTATLLGADSGAGGPAVEFFYKAATATEITYTANGVTLPPATAWTKSRLCFSPRRAGFAESITFSVSAGEAPCGLGSLSLDDVRSVRDPACPP
ncbi:MAG: calcium-binding EGF-like domain-containing protein [Labilithrix sp.]|nr:calcium-binding EGF-like domain-containing protein [Labilithrix sp.]